MKISMAVWTPGGFYAEREGEIRVVSDIQSWVLKKLDDLPDTIHEDKLMDWTKIEVTIKR